MRKKIICAGFLLLSFLLPAFAKDVTVQVVQHGGNTGAVGETALVLEDELLNSFFEAGHIVTNVPAAMSYSADDDGELRKELFRQSKVNGGDYAVQVRIYTSVKDSKNPKAVLLTDIVKIEWNITNVKNGKEAAGLSEGPSEKNGDSNVRSYVMSVASRIVKSL